MTALDIEGRMNLVGLKWICLFPPSRRQVVINCVFSTCDFDTITFRFLKSVLQRTAHFKDFSSLYFSPVMSLTETSGEV